MNTSNLADYRDKELYEGYNDFIENEARGIEEAVFNSRFALVEGYYRLGADILAENHNFERVKIYGKRLSHILTESLNKYLRVKISEKTVTRCIAFAKKYKSLDEVPEGKNISWNKVINKYLYNKEETKALEQIIEDLIDCPKCKGRGKIKKPKEKNKLDTPEKKLAFDQIGKTFELFEKTVNPTIDYGHRGNRGAVSYLIKKYGFESLTRLVQYAISIQGKDYAPTITTPYQLKEKLGALKIYHDKEKTNKTKIVKI